MTLHLLREAAHNAIDRAFDEYESGICSPPPGGAPGGPVVRGPGPETDLVDEYPSWTYRWPDGETEQYETSRVYRVTDNNRVWRVILARGTRRAWGKVDRGRVIVFGQPWASESSVFYPWTEFVETDRGSYAAPVPDPERPRASLADGADLPRRFEGMVIERADRLFDSIMDGPSLRLVLPTDDETLMVQHGFWVASLRKRL